MKRFAPELFFLLLAAEGAIVLVSWLWSAAFPLAGVRSLLSGEGIRWLCANYTKLAASPVLVWILMLAMAYGCLRNSKIAEHVYYRQRQPSYRHQRARLVAILLSVAYIAVILLLTAVPHAILLGATGKIFPSPFATFIVPAISLWGCLVGISYGVITGTLPTLSSVYNAMLTGIKNSATILLFYSVIVLLYYSMTYLLG